MRQRSRDSLLSRGLLATIGFYQKYISPLKPAATCRFEPTCSAYGAQAIRTHGGLRGSLYLLIRLSKCGPWHPGGFDPVPPVGGFSAVSHRVNTHPEEF